MNGSLKPEVSKALWEALDVRRIIAWRISRHGISPKQVMASQDEKLLSLKFVGPITLSEVRGAVGRIRLQKPEEADEMLLIPMEMNNFQGKISTYGRRDSLQALKELELEIIGIVADGHRSEFIVKLQKGMVLLKDHPSSMNHWWTLYFHGAPILHIYRCDSVRFEERFLNVPDYPERRLYAAA